MKVKTLLKCVAKKVLSVLGIKELKQKYKMKYYRWRLRFRYMKKAKRGEKINLVFVCHRPAVWNSLKTVCEAALKDEMFNVTIVTIPCKKQLPDLYLSHENYESEGAEAFWKDYPCRVLHGYNYDTKEWLDLKILNPDYIFFQQPYDCMRPAQYHSDVVASYATMCYVNYFYPSSEGNFWECLPSDFLKHLSFYFAVGKRNMEIVQSGSRKYNTKVVLSGYPRFDLLTQKDNSVSKLWKNPDNFKIIWTPRWTTNENNCHFFKYKEKLFELVDNHGDIDLLFRPHPQAFLEYICNKEMTKEEVDEYVEAYKSRNNAEIDFEKDYLPQFRSSNCLISDLTSLVSEYLMTGNPVIYCKNDQSICDIDGEWTKGLYFARTWEEVEKYIFDLKLGIDPLREDRIKYANNNFYFNPLGAGFYIKEFIKRDFMARC